MSQIDSYVIIENDTLQMHAESLRNSQSLSPETAMETKYLLGDSFKVKVSGKEITLTKFAAMFPGGATEGNTDVVAALESLSVASATTGGGNSNHITFAVTADSYEAISSAYKQARAGRQRLTIEVTIATDSLVAGQFYFKPISGNADGKWGDILTFKKDVTLSSTDAPVIELVGGDLGSNAVGNITLKNVRASNNFDVSLTTENSSDSSKVVTPILANNVTA